MEAIKSFIKRALNRLGYRLERNPPRGVPIVDRVDPNTGCPVDFTLEEHDTVAKVAPYTVTSSSCIVNLIRAVEYLERHRIPGDFVECGVYKGGSAMTMMITLLRMGRTDRDIWLYDTFKGLPAPDEVDVMFDGAAAGPEWLRREKKWCYAPLDAAKSAIELAGYPADRIHYVVGKVEDTLPGRMPERLSLLRLDTDWYSSTVHELVHLYPRLVSGGILIVDDYGHWQGARAAADEYLSRLGHPVFLSRMDYTARLFVKP